MAIFNSYVKLPEGKKWELCRMTGDGDGGFFFTCFKNIWNCSRYVMLQSHGQVPARYHSLLGIFGKFEVAYVHSLTLSSMIFFVAAYRGANVSCSQDGQGRSASIPLGVTGCTKVPYASSWPPASRRWRRTALPLLYPHFLGPVGHDFLVGGFKHGFYIFQKIYGDVIRQPLTNSIIFQAVFVVNLCEMMTSWRKWLNFSEHFFHHDVSKLVFFLMKHEIWGVPLFSEKKTYHLVI